MPNFELRSIPEDVEKFNLLGKYPGSSSGNLYYPGCGSDESPEQTDGIKIQLSM